MRIIIAFLLVLLLWLQYRLWLGDGGIPQVIMLEHELAAVEAEIESLQERNQAMEAEVGDLKQGLDAIEERARSEMGMIREGEVYFQVIEQPASGSIGDARSGD